MTYVLRDSRTMLRRNARRMLRYPVAPAVVVGERTEDQHAEAEAEQEEEADAGRECARDPAAAHAIRPGRIDALREEAVHQRVADAGQVLVELVLEI